MTAYAGRILATHCPMDEFRRSLEAVFEDLLSQGRRVTDMALRAVESYFAADAAIAEEVIRGDATVDHIDVQIERGCVGLMRLRPDSEHDLRWILTIVKVNNELERIADCAVNIAETVGRTDDPERPDTFQVMANSVVGMLRDTVDALSRRDIELAQRVLGFDDTVDCFKKELVERTHSALAQGRVSVASALHLLRVVKATERMADHCTNICEQAIYLESGKIVRHLPSGWTTPELPEDD
jgi:phosphate transport system protein